MWAAISLYKFCASCGPSEPPASTSISRISSCGLAASGKGEDESHLPVGDGVGEWKVWDICGSLSFCVGEGVLWTREQEDDSFPVVPGTSLV